MNSNKMPARIAGLLWLLATVTGGYSLVTIRSNLLVSADAALTANNLIASEFLFRTALVSSLFSQLFMFFLGLTLFHLFKQANKQLATVLLASVMLSVAIAVVNTLNQFGALLLLTQPDAFSAFNPAQLDALALLLLRLANSAGQGLVEIFWAPFYLSFALLILRSRYLPRLLGILLLIMGVGFALNILQKFLFPQFYPAVFTQLAMFGGALGGIPTILWLLVMGAKDQA